MVFIQAVHGRRSHKKPHIVTYDWLEDSIDAGRPIRRTETYHPGEPRDVAGMVAAWKETKLRVKTRTNGTVKTIRQKTAAAEAEAEAHGSAPGSRTAGVANREAAKASTNIAPETSTTMCQPKKAPQPVDIIEVYKDETDRFPYKIELTPVYPDAEAQRYTVEVNVIINRVPKKYRFRARLCHQKGNRIYQGASVSSAEEALEEFRTHFRRKTGYPWDQRLLRSGRKGGNGGKWLYEAPAPGMPTGAVRPEYTPGNPRCVRLQSLLPTAMRRPACLLHTSRPLEPKTPMARTAAFDDKWSVAKVSRPAPSCKVYKKRLGALPQPQKRKLEEPRLLEHRTKVLKAPDAMSAKSAIATKR